MDQEGQRDSLRLWNSICKRLFLFISVSFLIQVILVLIFLYVFPLLTDASSKFHFANWWSNFEKSFLVPFSKPELVPKIDEINLDLELHFCIFDKLEKVAKTKMDDSPIHSQSFRVFSASKVCQFHAPQKCQNIFASTTEKFR